MGEEKILILGLTQGAQDVRITGILIAIFIVVIFVFSVYKLTTKYVIWKKNKYPHAYYFFLREAHIDETESDFSIKEMIKILSIPKVKWKEIEEIELKRIQQENHEYEMIKANYSDGLACWRKEHPSASKSLIVSNIKEIIDFDKRQKEFLIAEEWEKAQSAFSDLCLSKKSTTPHSGCYSYIMNFQKTDYKGNSIQGKYPICQFFFSSFCTATDLDYTHFKQIQENNINIEKYRAGEIGTPDYVSIEISNFIKSLGNPVQVIVFESDLEKKYTSSDFNLQLEYHPSVFQNIDKISSNYVVVIDRVTTNNQFIERCKSITQKFKHQKPCIVYISLMKELSRKKMQQLIDKKNREEQQKQQIKDEINTIYIAIDTADIETAKDKLQEVKKSITQSTNTDKELVNIINKAETEFIDKYAVGIVDNFEIQYVDYLIPPLVQDKNNWKYPVTKYPENGCIVFPYRRKNIARRGFSEARFQKYLTNVFKGYDLLILGDCNILPIEDNRPFEPDIAIICKNHPSIRIDIEIDEPYAAFSRKPIHYIGCGDDFRDTCLNNIGWIVIRFTEYQVVSNPKECAAFIAQVLHRIQPSMVLPNDFLSYSTPKEIKRWTEIEAKVMASENIREEYLKHEFGIVDNKQLEVTDIKQTEKEKICATKVKPLIVKSYQPPTNTDFYERDSCIQFYPQEHIYLYNGQVNFFPVSNVISCFFKPFDSNYWSARKAKKVGILQGKIIEEFDVKGSYSRNAGTFMHQQIENYYKGLPYQKKFYFKYEGKYIHIEKQVSLELEYTQFIDFLKCHNFEPFKTEWAIYDEKLKIAGTIDMIHKREDVFDIYDWKRSYRILDSSGEPIIINKYGNKGLGELNYIEDTPYWHYCIQQNLYRYILEKNYDIKIGKMYIVVFCNDMNEYRKLEVPRMDEVVTSIVKACENGTVKKQLISLQEENLL